MPFSLQVRSDDDRAPRHPMSRTTAVFQFAVVFAGAFVIFDAAVTGGSITNAIMAQSSVTAREAKLSVASARKKYPFGRHSSATLAHTEQ